ncbi:MAG: hypothetical protein ABI435_02450 [Pseudolysinimonas sp.]
MSTKAGETGGRRVFAFITLGVGLAILTVGWYLPSWPLDLEAPQVSYVQSLLANLGTTVTLVGLLVLFERKIVESSIRIVRATSDRRFAKRMDARAHVSLSLKYFRNATGPLYETQSLTERLTIPLMEIPNDDWRVRVNPFDDRPFSLADAKRQDFGYNRNAIKWRRDNGIKLWDGSHLFVEKSDISAHQISVVVGNFFSFVTKSDDVSEEMESRRPFRKRPLRDVLSNPRKAWGDQATKLVISGAAVCVFETGNGAVVPMQIRSQEVVSTRGLQAVSPVFGMEPNNVGGTRSEFGIPMYNLMKEFLEEIFDQEGTKRVGDKPRLDDPDWIFRTREARRLRRELTMPWTSARITGVAMDPMEASVVVSYLVHFRSPGFYRYVRARARGNWEAEQNGGVAKISFVDFERATTLMTLDRMAVTSIYALDRARVHLGRSG